MNSEALLSTSMLWRACTLSIALFVAMFATRAVALPEPKVTIAYSLEAADGGTYFEQITDTPLEAGDADFVFDVVDPGPSNVTVLVASPLLVTLEFTADAPGGNIVDGPVELVDTQFEREFVISGLATVHTTLSTALSRKGTGTLSGSTITWENVTAPYQESVVGEATCTPAFFCGLASAPFPQNLSGTFDVPLPTFTVLTDTIFGDSFVSNNGTPGDGMPGTAAERFDDIDRPHPIPAAQVDATVKDTWDAVELPEPSGETLLLAGVLGLVGLGLLRERGGAAAFFASPR